MEEWDRKQPKGSCAACSRLDTFIMGDRGPIKRPLTMTEIGYFRFCNECLTNSEYSGPWLLIKVGPSTGHKWWISSNS